MMADNTISPRKDIFGIGYPSKSDQHPSRSCCVIEFHGWFWSLGEQKSKMFYSFLTLKEFYSILFHRDSERGMNFYILKLVYI